MGYLNPVEVMGYERFARDAAAAGVDGLLTVDMPPEESGELTRAMRAHGLDSIYLLAPTSTEARIQRIVESASGFIYYVSLRGVTGASHLDLAEVSRKVHSIRQHTALPVGVGFGIGTPEAAAAVAEFADAVIVGSALVRRIEENASQPDRILKELPGFLAQLRQAMDRAAAGPGSASGASR
jgi:tryptophan synthase alpha chain